VTPKYLKYLEEKAVKLNKKLLIESSDIPISEDNFQVFKEQVLLESSNGKKFKSLAVIKNVPVSRYKKNSNGRIYPKPLWEKVLREGSAEGNLALSDHPETEGSVTSVWGVWHEMRVKLDGVYADLYLIEEKPIRIIEAGGRLGTSTVGFGELDERDDCTVMAESFELERLSDIVLSPSQGTYFEKANLSDEQDLESKLTESTNKIKKEEKIIMSDKMDRFIEQNAKNHVKQKIKETNKSTNYAENISVLNETKEYITAIGDSALLENLVKEIENEVEKNQKILAEKANTAESLSEQVQKEKAELEEKYNKLVEEHDKAIKILELAKITEEEKKTLLEDSTVKDEDLTTFKEERSDMMADIKIFKEERENMLDDVKQFKEEREDFIFDMKHLKEEAALRDSDIKIFKEERDDLLFDLKESFNLIKEAKLRISFYEKELEKRGFKFDEAGTISKQDNECVTNSDDALAQLGAKPKAKKDNLMNVPGKKAEKEEPKSKEHEVKTPEVENPKKEKEEVKESAVATFVKEATTKNKTLTAIKKELLESKTLFEASEKVRMFLDKKDDVVKAKTYLKEDIAKRPAWLGNRD